MAGGRGGEKATRSGGSYQGQDASGNWQFIPHAEQKPIWDSNAKIVAAISGHYGGKSHLGPPWIFREAKNHRGADFLICGPTYNTLRKSAIPKLQEFCRMNNLPWDYDHVSKIGYRAGYREYALPGGGTIFFVTADKPGSMQGAHVRAFWMDETVDTDYYVYETLRGRIAGNDGRGLITSTPYDMGWLYQNIYLPWKNGDAKFKREQIFCHQWRSIDNPAFPKSEWEAMRASLAPWRFRMLYEGQFERPEGLVYDCFQDSHFIKAIPIPQGSTITLGIDWGFTDPLAAIWVVKTLDDSMLAVNEYYKAGWMAHESVPGEKQARQVAGAMAMPEEMIDEIVAQCVEKNLIPNAVYCDPSGPENVEYARRKFEEIGCRKVFKANNAILPGISRCYQLVRSGNFQVFEGLANFRDEQTKYAWEIDKNTGDPLKSAAPVDKNNHAMDAWRYALAGSKDEPVNSFGMGRISLTPTPFGGRDEFERFYRRGND